MKVKINKILRWTGTLERLSHKYKWFNADPEFKKRFKDVFFNFVKLINSFTYAANKEYPNIEDEYLSIPDLHNTLFWLLLFK